MAPRVVEDYAELPGAAQHLGGERLVDGDQDQLRQHQAGAPQGLAV